MTPHSSRAPRGLLLGALLLALACQDARYGDNTSSTQAPSLQRSSMRASLTSQGLAQLLARAEPDGLALETDGLDLVGPSSLSVSLGALNQQLAVERYDVEVRETNSEVQLQLSERRVPVALRIQTNSGLRICRYEVRADQISTSATLQSFIDAEGNAAFAPINTPSVDLLNPSVEPISACEPLQGLDDQFAPPLPEAIIGFLREGLEAATREHLSQNASGELGLIVGRKELARLSPFSNRRGKMLVSGSLNPDNPARFDDNGLQINLDYAIQAQRADCTPPLDFDLPAGEPAESVDINLVDQFNADFGLAISRSVLERSFQAATLAGFACRGLDAPASLQRDDLDLEQLGLGELPIGQDMAVVLAPQALPRLELAPSNNVLQLSWNGLSFDLYGISPHGARLLIFSIDLSFTVSLRLKAAGAGLMGFDIDAVNVDDAQLRSEWFSNPPPQADINRWARRFLLLLFADNLALPLPLSPDTPLNLTASQVRAQDILLLLSFED